MVVLTVARTAVLTVEKKADVKAETKVGYLACVRAALLVALTAWMRAGSMVV